MRSIFRLFSRDLDRACPGFTANEGMFTRLPFTVKWPWRTSCRASARVSAKPMRKTTLSSRSSSSWSSVSPVLPLARAARWK